MKALSRTQVRQVDRLASEQLGIEGIVLMENAGRQAADAICQLMGWPIRLSLEFDKGQVAILCGAGNNGGDGYVIARHLHNRGVQVAISASKRLEELSGDAAVNAQICRRMGLAIQVVDDLQAVAPAAQAWNQADVVVDALLGTGFAGEVRQPLASMILACNELAGPEVVAVDIPSGLDCDTGEPTSATIRADLTVTFVTEKLGFSQAQAREYLGRVVVADIGAPPQLIALAAGSGDSSGHD